MEHNEERLRLRIRELEKSLNTAETMVSCLLTILALRLRNFFDHNEENKCKNLKVMLWCNMFGNCLFSLRLFLENICEIIFKNTLTFQNSLLPWVKLWSRLTSLRLLEDYRTLTFISFMHFVLNFVFEFHI